MDYARRLSDASVQADLVVVLVAFDYLDSLAARTLAQAFNAPGITAWYWRTQRAAARLRDFISLVTQSSQYYYDTDWSKLWQPPSASPASLRIFGNRVRCA